MAWSGKNETLNTSLEQQDVEAMLKEADASYTIKRYPRDSFLFWEAEPHETHYFLIDGLVEIYATDSAGRKKSIDVYASGSFIGYQITRDNSMTMTTARAQKDSLVIAIPKESFFKTLHNCPDFADTTVRYLFGLLSMQTREVINSSFYVAAQRVPLLLLELAHEAIDESGNTEDPIVLPYGNNDIAEMLGVSRNSVTASISQLQTQGVLEKQRSSIRIVDLAKLDRITHLEHE